VAATGRVSAERKTAQGEALAMYWPLSWSKRRRRAVHKLVLLGSSPSLVLSEDAERVLDSAIRIARRAKCGHIGTGHVLLALIEDGRGTAVSALRESGVDATKIRSDLSKEITPAGHESIRFSRPLRLSTLRQAFRLAIAEADRSEEKVLTPDHLLCGLMTAEGSVVGVVLKNLGVSEFPTSE
jgi:ATP-dependent Clp protease ATP-binding subunit ClpA